MAVMDLARAYAEHMDGWRAEPDTSSEYRRDERAFLVHDGERVRLRVEQKWNAPRLIVAPVFPWRHGVSGPRSDSITIAIDREPAKAAKDILRRAVPAVIDGARQWEANIAAEDERQARQRALRDDLAAQFPALDPWPGDEPKFSWRPARDDDDAYRTHGTVKLHTGYRTGPSGHFEENGYEGNIELTGLSMDQVKRVLHAITEEG